MELAELDALCMGIPKEVNGGFLVSAAAAAFGCELS